jgi:hypothetical protein
VNGRRLLARLLSPVGFVLAALCVLLPFVTIRVDGEAISRTLENSPPLNGLYQLSYAGHDLLRDGRPDLLLRQEQDGDPSNGLEEFRFENFDGGYMLAAPRIDQQPWLYVVAVLMGLGAAAAALPQQRLRAVIAAATALPAALAVTAATVRARQMLIGALNPPPAPDVEPPLFDVASLIHFGYGFWLAVGLLTIIGLGSTWFAAPGRPVEPVTQASSPSERREDQAT